MHRTREEEAVGALLDFPHGDVTRVRLLLGRRVLWLRRHWEHNPLREYRGMVISDQQADALLAGQDRAAEQAFYHDDPEAAGLSQAIEEHAGRLAERDAGLLAAGAPTPMQRLAAVLGLSPFEQDVLLLALAAEVVPAIADLYGYVQDDATRRSPTLELALSLCAGDEPDSLESRRRLVGQASLERFSLTVPEPGAGPAPTLRAGYRLDDRIRDYLLGVNRVDDRAASWVREIPVEPLAEAAYPSELQRIEELVRAAVDRVPDWLPVINLVGPDMVDRPGLTRAACDRLGVRLLQLDPASLPAAAGERTAALRLLEREALLIPAAFYLDVPRPAAGEPAADPAAVLDELGALVFAGSWRPLSPAAVRSGRSLIAVEVAPPGPVRRRELWGLVAGGGPAADDDWLDRLTEQFRVGPVEIRRAAEAAGRLADPPLSARDLWRACRVNAAGDLDDLALRLEPGAAWDDLVLPAESEQALPRDRGPGGQPDQGLRTLGVRGQAAPGPGHQRAVLRAQRDRQDHGRRGAGRRPGPRPVPDRPVRRGQQVHRRDREEPPPGVRRRRVRWGDPVLRRGRRAVRQALGGQGQPRPLRQHRDQLPAAADGGLPGPGRAGHQHEGPLSTPPSCGACAS